MNRDSVRDAKEESRGLSALKRAARSVLLLGISLSLGSCLMLFAGLLSPKIELSATLLDADSYYGFFTVAVYVENTGGATAQNLEYELFINGSSGSPISYELWPDNTDTPTAVGEGSTRLATFMGQGNTYVPYSFDLFVYWEDTSGTVYGPAHVSGNLNPD